MTTSSTDRKDDDDAALRACVDALAQLSASASRWAGLESGAVVDELVDLTRAALRADAVLARIGHERAVVSAELEGAPNDFAAALAPHMGRSGRLTLSTFGTPLNISVILLAEGVGSLAVGSRRSDFPTPLETTILEAVASQAEARLRGEPRIGPDSAVRQRDPPPPSGILGTSAALRQALAELQAAAATNATVLLLGESGTGKELFARELHRCSSRSKRPFVKVNCSAIPIHLFESEFFGHERGAFTGAARARKGRFAAADGGTIFLDEVGELPLDVQPKLLRILQEGEYERVGDDVTRKVDVRVVAATNRDLQADVDAGGFRKDLYYRLNVVPIAIPPLRDRLEDIEILARHFIARFSRGRVPTLSDEDVAMLSRSSWPGNIRQLENVIERALVLGGGERLLFATPLVNDETAPPRPSVQEVVSAAEWRRRDRDNLVAALERCDGRIYGPGGAAALLGMKPTTLQSKLRTFGIRGPRRRLS